MTHCRVFQLRHISLTFIFIVNFHILDGRTARESRSLCWISISQCQNARISLRWAISLHIVCVWVWLISPNCRVINSEIMIMNVHHLQRIRARPAQRHTVWEFIVAVEGEHDRKFLFFPFEKKKYTQSKQLWSAICAKMKSCTRKKREVMIKRSFAFPISQYSPLCVVCWLFVHFQPQRIWEMQSTFFLLWKWGNFGVCENQKNLLFSVISNKSPKSFTNSTFPSRHSRLVECSFPLCSHCCCCIALVCAGSLVVSFTSFTFLQRVWERERATTAREKEKRKEKQSWARSRDLEK